MPAAPPAPALASLDRSHAPLVATASFLEILALLVENQVPLHEGVLLAAEACGDADMVRDAGQLAARLQQGGPAASPAPSPPGTTPFRR